MKVRKVVRRNLEHAGPGVEVAGGVNAVVAATVDEPGPTTVSVSSTQRIVQRSHAESREEHE